nr:MAG TPA: hypothetical protein [Caudoviricetes sp.]
MVKIVIRKWCFHFVMYKYTYFKGKNMYNYANNQDFLNIFA